MWRFTADPVRLLIIDARALAPFALWIAHMREWTFILAIIGVLFFSVLA
ncbi:MAG: IcmT/TraK family protein, partial [Gluconobacter sp.]